MLWIAIFHLILMKSCNFYFVWIFSGFLQVRIHFLLQLYTYWFWMSIWFRIRFIIILRFIVWVLSFRFPELEAIFMTFCIFISTSCWLLCFLTLFLFEIPRKVMRSLSKVIVSLKSRVYTASCRMIQRTRVNIRVKKVRITVTLVKLFCSSKIDRLVHLTLRKEKFVSFNVEVRREVFFAFALIY